MLPWPITKARSEIFMAMVSFCSIRDTLKNEKNLKSYAMMVSPMLANEPNLNKMVKYGLSFNRDSVTIRLSFDNSTGNSNDQQIESY